jgi:hypothetical protein
MGSEWDGTLAFMNVNSPKKMTRPHAVRDRGSPQNKNRPQGAAGVNLNRDGFVQTLCAAPKAVRKILKNPNWKKFIMFKIYHKM